MHPILDKIQNSLKQIPLPPAFKPLAQKIFRKKDAAPAAPVRIVACDFGKSKIVLLEIEKSSEQVRLIKFQKTPRDAAAGEKDSDLLKKCFESGGFSPQKLRISVKGQGVIIRFIQFPQMKRDDLRNAISFEVDQYIPFKAHEVVWDFHVLEEDIAMAAGGRGMNILLVAVKRDDLNHYLQIFHEAGRPIDLIDIDAIAVINALGFFHPESTQTTAGILDVGTEISTLSIIQNGKPRFIRDISYGSFDILKRLKRKLGLSHEQAVEHLGAGGGASAPEVIEVIKEGLGDLISDLRVSLNYYLDQVQSAESLKTLFVSGGIGFHPFFLENLKNDLGFGVETFDILKKIEIASTVDGEILKLNQGILPVAMGLCIRD